MKSRARCLFCRAWLALSPTGRPKSYCGPTCRQRARRARLALQHPDTLHAALGTDSH